MPHSYDFSVNHHMRPQLLQFIRGIPGPRQNEVDLKQICNHFAGTPESFVRDQVYLLLDSEHVDIRRTTMGRTSGRCVYMLTDKGEQLFQSYVRYGACHTG